MRGDFIPAAAHGFAVCHKTTSPIKQEGQGNQRVHIVRNRKKEKTKSQSVLKQTQRLTMRYVHQVVQLFPRKTKTQTHKDRCEPVTVFPENSNQKYWQKKQRRDNTPTMHEYEPPYLHPETGLFQLHQRKAITRHQCQRRQSAVVGLENCKCLPANDFYENPAIAPG